MKNWNLVSENGFVKSYKTLGNLLRFMPYDGRLYCVENAWNSSMYFFAVNGVVLSSDLK